MSIQYIKLFDILIVCTPSRVLMGEDKRYYGSLRHLIQDPVYIDNPMQIKKPEKEAWYFDENDGSKGFSQLVDYFRDVVTAWYE